MSFCHFSSGGGCGGSSSPSVQPLEKVLLG